MISRKLLPVAAAGVCVLLSSSSALAKAQFTKVDEGLYYGFFQANRLVQGGAFTDNVTKNSRKLWYAAHRQCLDAGFEYIHMVTPMELAKDEELKAVWEVMAGGEANSSEMATYSGTASGRANKVKRLLKFSAESAEGYERCTAKPSGDSPW